MQTGTHRDVYMRTTQLYIRSVVALRVARIGTIHMSVINIRLAVHLSTKTGVGKRSFNNNNNSNKHLCLFLRSSV